MTLLSLQHLNILKESNMADLIKRSGYIIGWILCLIPAAILFVDPSINDYILNFPLYSPWDAWKLLGKITAVTGTIMFALNFVLAARFPFVEYMFSGLDKVYKAHHKWGAYAFILLLLHPFFLSLSYLETSASAVVMFYIDGLNRADYIMGELAFGVMFVVLMATFYAKQKYENWKDLHQWIGISMLLAAIHIYLINSTTTLNLPLRIYILIFVSIGIACWFYTTIFKKFNYRYYSYIVNNVSVKENVTFVDMKSVGRKLKHKGGQFGFFEFMSPELIGQTHPFSFTSKGDNNITIAVKKLGDYTNVIQLLLVGTKAKVEGPFGMFGDKINGKDMVWIGGGIGITPFISMAKNLSKNDSVKLWYCTKSPLESVFSEELKELTQKNQITIYSYYSDESGTISADKIFTKKTSVYWLCGPTGFMNCIESGLLRLGVPRQNIISEKFALDL
jgi:predicted ferric reductase